MNNTSLRVYLFLSGAPPSPPPPPGAGPPGAPPPPPPPPGMGPAPSVPLLQRRQTAYEVARKHKPRKQMRKVNWVKVPRNVATKPTTLWHPSTKDDEKVEPKIRVDMETVEDLFSRAEIVKKGKGEKEGGGDGETVSKPKVISLLDQKTSLNVNIFLKQFKRCVQKASCL